MTIKDYNSWGKSRLVEEIKRLSGRKKYGLVWEEKPEDVVERCKTELPVLEEVSNRGLEVDSSLPTNFIIEGDNYHSLSVLNYTHAGKVDVIYIDPPYNTGNNSWRYNNRYVDSNDAFRHSKWLSFMRKRLELSKKLLKRDGAIIVTIDDYEVFQLGMLMDEVFGEKNRLANITVLNKKSGRTTDSHFATCHEYYLIYARDISTVKVGLFELSEDSLATFKYKDDKSAYKWRDFLRTGGFSTPKERPNSYYPIYYNEKNERISIKKISNSIEIFPIDSKGQKRVWRQTRPSLDKLIKLGEIKVQKNRQGRYSVRIKARPQGGQKPKTVWDNPKYDAATHGTKLLEKVLDESKMFDFPKSMYAVHDSLMLFLKDKKESIVLDFFAGSGTTGHAVMELNKKDNGKRSFILCTNNENGIAEEVTYPRIKNASVGYGDVEGVPTNIRYLKTDFVQTSNVSDDTRRELIKRSTDMICLKESTFKKVYDNKKFKIYQNISQVTGVLFDLDSINEFKKRLEKIGLKSHIYVFSLTSDAFVEDFTDLEIAHKIQPIPEGILEVYRKLFS